MTALSRISTTASSRGQQSVYRESLLKQLGATGLVLEHSIGEQDPHIDLNEDKSQHSPGKATDVADEGVKAGQSAHISSRGRFTQVSEPRQRSASPSRDSVERRTTRHSHFASTRMTELSHSRRPPPRQAPPSLPENGGNLEGQAFRRPAGRMSGEGRSWQPQPREQGLRSGRAQQRSNNQAQTQVRPPVSEVRKPWAMLARKRESVRRSKMPPLEVDGIVRRDAPFSKLPRPPNMFESVIIEEDLSKLPPTPPRPSPSQLKKILAGPKQPVKGLESHLRRQRLVFQQRLELEDRKSAVFFEQNPVKAAQATLEKFWNSIADKRWKELDIILS